MYKSLRPLSVPGDLNLDWVLLLRGEDGTLGPTLRCCIGVESCRALVAEFAILDLRGRVCLAMGSLNNPEKWKDIL